jgi:ABC-type transport system involved in multi-copper enzyme maturation permease subunit
MKAEATTLRTGATGTWGVLRGEVSRWLGRRGLFHLVLWLAVIEWILYTTVATENQPFGYLGFETLINMLVIFPVMAGMVLTAAAMCGDYHDGTTGWVLSKPVPRGGYVAASVAGLWLGLAVTAIVVPGLVAYWWLPRVEPYRFVTPEAPELGRFLVALGLLSIILAFFMAATTLLSIVIRRRGVVVAIVAWLLLMLRTPILPYADWMDYTPSRLIRTDIAPGGWSEITEYIHDVPFDAMPAVTGTIAMTVAFVAGAILVFRRLDF